MVRLFGGSVWETGTGTGHARPFRAEHMPMGHNRTTNRRTNAKKETTEDGPKRGWTRPPRRREGDRQGRPINSVSVSDFMGSFSQRKKQRERQVQCRQASGASKRAGRKYVCEAIMQIVRPRNIFDAAVSDG